MTPNPREKSTAPRRALTVALALSIGGAFVGIALALGFSLLLLDACQGEQNCQKPMLALLGGVGVVQAVAVIATSALVDYLNRKSERRLLHALRLSSAP